MINFRTLLAGAALLGAGLTSPNAWAQDNAGNPFFASYPESGSWFAMDGSNTGFFLESQDGRLAGAYFGFDGNGENVWLLFNGALEPVFNAETPPIQTGWRLATTMTQAANGGCILDCAGEAPGMHQATAAGAIELTFTGRSTALFSIDGGEAVPVIPLYFGVPAITEEFAIERERPDGSTFFEPLLLSHPDLEGTWLVATADVVTDADGNITESALAESAGIIEIGPRQVFPVPVGVPPQVFAFLFTEAPILRDTTGLFGEDAEIVCAFVRVFGIVEGTESGGSCEISPVDADRFPQANFVNSFGNLRLQTDSRFVMLINATGANEPQLPLARLEFFRLGYD